jgi:MFS family permease
MQVWLRIKHRLTDMFKPRATLEAQNAWNLYGDIAWFGVLAGIANSFLSVFVLRVGGSDLHVGLLSSLPALIGVLASIPGSRMVERENKPLSILVLTAILNRVGYLAIALVPFFFVTHQADAIVVLVGLLTIPGAIANVAFTTMFAQAVAPEHRAHVVSVRNVWIGIVSTIVSFLGGKFLERVLFPINYQILFVIAFAGSMVSAYYLTRIRLPASPPTIAAPAIQAPRNGRAWLALLRDSRAYSQFTLSSFIFHWGLFFPAPLYTIYWVRVLHANEGWIGLYNMVGSATSIVFYPLWGRLSTRRGNLFAIVLSTLGLAAYPFATALSPSVEWILLVSFLGGVFTAGYGLAFFNRLLEVCPEHNRASHIAIYNTVINIAAFISPLISTALTAAINLHVLLLMGAALRLIGGGLFWRQHTDTR